MDYKYLSNRTKQIKVVKNYISKFKDIIPVLLTGDFNCGNTHYERQKADSVPYLLKNGFFNAASEAKDCFQLWTYPSIGYIRNIYGSFLKRNMHKNGKNLIEQKYYRKECDEEIGEIIDYCFRCNYKVFFEKYKVVTDYEKCGGISSDHYPIYIEAFFINSS